MNLVQCTNNLYYTSPVWEGIYSQLLFLVKFKDDQLVLMLETQRKKFPAMKAAKIILKDWNVKIGKGMYTDLYLGTLSSFKDAKGYEFELKIIGKLPEPHSCELQLTHPPLSTLKYCWEVSFPIDYVWQYFQKGLPKHLYSDRLSQFLLNGAIGPGYTYQSLIKKRLLKQFDMRKISLEEAIVKFGERVTVCRKFST